MAKLGLLLLAIQTPGTTPQNRSFTFTGEVREGQSYRTSIGHGLDFVLTPSSDADSGWTIQITQHGAPSDSECDDFVWVVTQPYRSYNMRDLDTSYGTTAQEAVRISPREFNFVLNCADFKIESKRVNLAIYPSTAPKQEVDEALAKLGTSPQGSGKLWIEDSKITSGKSSGTGEDVGVIHWIGFKGEVKFPPDRALHANP